MKLEYKYLVGFSCIYTDAFDVICSIYIDTDKITSDNFNTLTIDRVKVVLLELGKYSLKISFRNDDSTTSTTTIWREGKDLLKEIKAYYIYNKRKAIIDSI